MNFKWYTSAKKRFTDVLVRTDEPIMIHSVKRDIKDQRNNFFLNIRIKIGLIALGCIAYPK